MLHPIRKGLSALLLAAAACTSLDGLTTPSEPGVLAGDVPDAGSVGDAREPADSADASVSPASYAFKRRLRIENLSGTELPSGYTIRIGLGAFFDEIAGSGKLRADLRDLRVFGPDGERDRIVDAPGGLAPVAIQFSLSAAIAPASRADYELRYGSPSASPPPAAGAKVFTVYDDFDVGISDVWLRTGQPTAATGTLVLRKGQQDGITTVATADGLRIPSTLEASIRVSDPQSVGKTGTTTTLYYWFGYQRTGDFQSISPWVIWVARDKGSLQPEQLSPGGCETLCTGPSTPQTTAFRHYLIERDPLETRFYLDGTLVHRIPLVDQADYSVMVRNYALTSDLLVDWVRGRSRADVEPRVELGAEERL